MIEREIIPRHLNLFEFCKKHNLPLVIELGEHAFKVKYVKMYVKGHTLFERSGHKTFPDFATEGYLGDSFLEVTKRMIDNITGHGIYFNEKLVVKVPTLSYNIDNWEADVEIIQGPVAVDFFNWLEEANLTLVISTGETIKGRPFVRAEFKEYGIVGSHCGDGEKLTLAIEDTELLALKELTKKISEKYIAPQYYKNGWSCVDETKKIKVPALY